MMSTSRQRHLTSYAAGCAALLLFAASPPATGRARAQRSTPPAAQRPAAAAPAPQVSVAGIRVVGPGAGANGTELRAFNESPGTAIAVLLKAAAGSGIVEIDGSESRVETFADDKGQSLMEEARVGPFPKVSDDGTVALFEIEVRARPSAGAVSVSAQGAVAVTVAAGSKPQRIANVRLEPARTLKMGTATITLKDVTPSDDSTSLTLALSRPVMRTIRDVRFFDAKGEQFESRRTGSGYINDAAELSYDVKTKDKVATVEFDVWQNQRSVKVPFNVKASLALDRSPGSDAATPSLPGGSRPLPAADPPQSERAGAQAGGPAGRSAPAGNQGRGSTPSVAPAPGDGAASVDAVVKQMQTAAASGKASDLLAVIYPDDRAAFGQGMATVVAFSVMAHMDDEKASEQVKKDVDALFAKHKVKPPLNRNPAEIFKDVDLAAFVTDAMAHVKRHVKKGEDPAAAVPVPKGTPQGVKITGDSAVAKLEGRDITFTRLNGRWFIRLTP